MLALDYSGTLCVHERCVRKTLRFESVVTAGVAGRHRHAKLVWIRCGLVMVVSNLFDLTLFKLITCFFVFDIHVNTLWDRRQELQRQIIENVIRGVANAF